MTLILDKSASIESIKGALIEGTNGLFREQAQVESTLTVTFIQFDYTIEFNEVNQPVQHIQDLTAENFIPRNQSSLLDAIGTGINSTDALLDELAEADAPEAVVFVIVTDGKDTSSSVFPIKDVKDAIVDRRKELGWEFVLLTTSEDFEHVSSKLGLQEDSVLRFASSEPGTLMAFSSLSRALSDYRSVKTESCIFLPEDQTRQEELLNQ